MTATNEDGLKNPLQLFDVKGKVAVITGASGAFGALAARVLAGAGCKLVLTAGKKAELDAIVAECGKDAVGVNVRPNSEAACAGTGSGVLASGLIFFTTAGVLPPRDVAAGEIA